MPRVARRKRLTRRAGWWKDKKDKEAQKQANVQAAAPVIAGPVLAPPAIPAPVISAPVNAAPMIAPPVITGPMMSTPMSAASMIATPPDNQMGHINHPIQNADNPGNEEYLQGTEELIQHLKKHLKKSCGGPLQYPEGEQ